MRSRKPDSNNKTGRDLTVKSWRRYDLVIRVYAALRLEVKIHETMAAYNDRAGIDDSGMHSASGGPRAHAHCVGGEHAVEHTDLGRRSEELL